MDDPRSRRSVAAAAEAVGPAMDNVGGPAGILGRAIGLGADEVAAGVPGWAWFGVGIVAGGIAMYFLRPRVEAFVGD
jgi:hypothetical protein